MISEPLPPGQALMGELAKRPRAQDFAIRTYVLHAYTGRGNIPLEDEELWMAREFRRGANGNVVIPSQRKPDEPLA